MNDPRFARTFATLPTAGVRRRRGWFVPAIVTAAAAASIAVVGVRARTDELRAKGSASLRLVSQTGGPALSTRAGEIVEMRANPGAHRFALVVAVDASSTSVLWPPGATRSGSLEPGALISVQLRLTPGRTKIVAGFSDSPLDVSGLTAPGNRTGVELHELEVNPEP